MPKLAGEVDTESDDVDEVFEDTLEETDTEARKQLNGTLQDEIDEDEADGDPEHTDAHADDDGDLDPKGKGEEEDSNEEEEEEDAGEEVEYSVESIRDHAFVKGQLRYCIKWQGYSDEENTWEPEEHLLPHSRRVLAAYHKKIGGEPQPPIKRGKSKQNLRKSVSSEEPPAPKRQKRKVANDLEEEVGSWTPKGDNWEDQVDIVETLERNKHTDQLMAFIRFKNGKRSKVGMDVVYRHCPVPMLKFYEANLKFK